MKVRCNRHELAEALAAIGGVVAARTPKPILQGVLIEAHADHCLLAATDLEVGIRFVVTQVEVDDQGTSVVPADKLGQIVRELADEVILLETEDSVCHVRGQGSHFQIYAQDPADFPPVAQLEGEPDFEIEADALHRMAEWTVFAAARENTRYAINGILWAKEKDVLTLAGTDGRRLSRARGKLASGGGGSLESIVPVKAMNLLQRILGENGSTVAVKLSSNQLVVKSARATLSTGLVEGQFPNYQDVVPTDCNCSVHLKTADFLSAVRRAALLTNEESKGVRLSFRNDSLTFSSRAPAQGEATITLPISYSAPELDIGFNPVFLVDVLRVVHTDEVTMELKEANRPGVISCDPNLLYVVMPVNLS